MQAKLNFLLEGFELYDVTLNDELAETIFTDVAQLRAIMLKHVKVAFDADPAARTGLIKGDVYASYVEAEVGLSLNSVKTQIDRRRLMRKKTEGTSITVYHVQGNNNRWVNNSQDHSVNVVTQ